MATVNPSRTMRPCSPRARSSSVRAARARRRGRNSLDLHVEVREVDVHFEIRDEGLEILPQFRHVAGEPPAEPIDGGLEPERRLGAHDVEHRLGLVERDAPVLERPLRELASIGEPRPRRKDASSTARVAAMPPWQPISTTSSRV